MSGHRIRIMLDCYNRVRASYVFGVLFHGTGCSVVLCCVVLITHNDIIMWVVQAYNIMMRDKTMSYLAIEFFQDF